MEDGSFFEHEPQSGTLTMAGIGTFHLSVNGDTLSYSGGAWTLHVGGDITVTAGGNANVTAANATVKAGTITLDGNVHITGTLNTDSTIDAKGDIRTPATLYDHRGANHN